MALSLSRSTSAQRAVQTISAHLRDQNEARRRQAFDDPFTPDPEPLCPVCGAPLTFGVCEACKPATRPAVCVECRKAFFSADKFAVLCGACERAEGDAISRSVPAFESRQDAAHWRRRRLETEIAVRGLKVGDRCFYAMTTGTGKRELFYPGTLEAIRESRLLVRLDSQPSNLRVVSVFALFKELPAGAVAR